MDEIVSKNLNIKCCKCHERQSWRIYLRNCKHIVCISCLLEYLRVWIQDKHKARIKCPKKSCKIRIHENDIRALLDKNNRDLDHFISDIHRDWLLYQHDKDVIKYALGGEKHSKQCPLCKNFYAKLDGCNYVRCSNLRCNQWFCFECGDPIKSWQHFSQGTCKVGWDDIFKLSYFLRFFLFIDTCTNCFIMPLMFIVITVLLPAYVCISYPYFIINNLKNKHEKNHGYDKKKWILIVKILIITPLLIPIGLILGICTVFTSFLLCFLYLFLSMIKCIPPISHLFKVMDFIGIILGVFGFSNWKQILQDSKAARVELEIDQEQELLEKSELLKTLERNSLQEREHQLKLAVKEARKDRAIGAAQCNDGAVDLGMVIKKGAHNIEALQKGELGELEMIKVSDVKVNDAVEVIKNVNKVKKFGKK